MSNPNKLGRALEYALCEKIKSLFSNISFTERAIKDQKKDKVLYDSLSIENKQQYEFSTDKICSEWLKTKISSSTKYTLDRLPDSAGVKGDVTDIRLESNGYIINISLKHNHGASKHPRLTRVPNWINIDKDIKYKSDYDNIWNSFFVKSNDLLPEATLFRELIDINKDFINDNLYNPLCELVSNYLLKNIKTSSQVEALFKFMVGKYNFYKIIDKKDVIVIQDFINLKMPTEVKIIQTNKSYIDMNFNNGVKLKLRLHTASSRMKTKSIKFDAEGSFDDIDSINIKK